MIFIFKKIPLYAVAGALCFFCTIAHSYAGDGTISIEGIDSQSITPQIVVNVTLKGNRRAIIDENQFSLFVDGVKIENIRIDKKMEAHNDLMILIISIDSSRSIKKSFLKDIKKISSNLVSAYGKKAQVVIYRFDDEIALLQGFNSKTEDVISSIDAITSSGSKTLLYDAIYNCISKLSKSGDINKSLIVFTDGKDEGSSVTLEDILLYATEKNIAVNFVAEKNYSKSSVLNRIAKITGGKVFYVGSESVESKILKYLEPGRSDKFQLIYKDDNLWEASHVLEVLYKNNEEIDRAISAVSYPGYLKRYFRFPFIITIILFLVIFVVSVMIVFLLKKGRNGGTNKISNNDFEAQISSHSVYDHFDSSLNVINEQNPRFLRGWLIQKEGGESGKKFPLYWQELDIGSHPRNGIVVNDPGISSSHARIRFAKESFYLLDLASDSGTFLNGRKVLRPKRLNDWDEIRIGSTTFIFRGTLNRV